jgi:hypothetical protein
MKISFRLWLESQTEVQALKILGNDQNLLNQIIQGGIDPSFTKKHLPAIAYFHKYNNIDLGTLKLYFEKYSKVEGRLKPIQTTNRGVLYNGQLINFDNFKGMVDNAIGFVKGKKNDAMPESGRKVAESNNIEVYESNSQKACIKYSSQGGHEFCIGKPRNIWWQSYRDREVASFYFIFDRNRSSNDPLHVVVVNVNQNEITISNAQDNSVEEESYFAYLQKNGISKEVFKNIPKDEGELGIERQLGKPNNDLEWFKGLTVEMKSRYIGWKHALTDEQFNYLWGNGQWNKVQENLIHNYVDAQVNSDRKKLFGNQEAKVLSLGDDNNIKKFYLNIVQMKG